MRPCDHATIRVLHSEHNRTLRLAYPTGEQRAEARKAHSDVPPCGLGAGKRVASDGVRDFCD